jgi:hypothetical protein
MSTIAPILCPTFLLHKSEPQRIISLEQGRPPAIYWVHDVVERSITYIIAFERGIEFVRVFYDANLALTKAYFSAHSADQGTWAHYQPLRLLRPMAYVSLGTHALYPKPGIVHRCFGFGNDVTTPCGISFGGPNAVLRPMPNLEGQWSCTTAALRGVPTRNASMFRLFYPLSKCWRGKKKGSE